MVFILLMQTWYSRLDAGSVMVSTMYWCFFWMPISMLLSLFVHAYWLYMLYWLLSFILYLFIFFTLISACEKYGKANLNEGALGFLAVPYLFLATIAGSLLLKGIIVLVRWLIAKL